MLPDLHINNASLSQVTLLGYIATGYGETNMMQKPIRKSLPITALTVDLNLNFRDKDNIRLSYDLDHMDEDILRLGRIVDPIHVEQKGDGKDAIYIVLRGNRRTLSGQRLMLKPDLPSDTKEALGKVDVVVYKDLTDTERLELIADHGSQKPITRSEVVTAVWRLDRQLFSEIQIANLLYFTLAKFTGNEKKLLEIPTDPKQRIEFLRKWLHGTLGNFILAAARMGDYVRSQFVLTHKDEDKLLPEGTKIEMRTTRDRIQQLSQSITKDKSRDGKGWSVERGGETFNTLLEKFKAEDNGSQEREKKTKLSSKELEQRASRYFSAGIRRAFSIAAGDTSDDMKNIADDDNRYARMEKVDALLVQYGQGVKDENVKKFIGVILHADATMLEEYLKGLCA